ncbi:aromatic amino acid ammonia-lyase [Allostreptomyces psammosilenae]|uniref:Histidine ammonia-lyase n=1 Tax=Allostreptomyces psammosilenae TaxID=1892865 RepID=A0A852ZY26_9ACTN|nr:aromatic amino acid ammonia-lyase [Allostreptomyces psammosilenae]NYI06955.1 histidine ammonia-lyase [Allostreptomyces psammosilenae]
MTYHSARDLVRSTEHARLVLEPGARARMDASADRLERALADGAEVYGLTRGFGPLATHPAGPDDAAQGLGLIHHLAAGQGPALPAASTRLMLRLRLEGMTRGYSGVRPATWAALAGAYNAGFLPVVPARGSVSASGDLLPLAHAALAFAGDGEAWRRAAGGEWRREPAAPALARLGLRPVRWRAREALAFVNGSSASLAVALENHVALLELGWLAAMLTGRVVALLGATGEPYLDGVTEARGGLAGHRHAARWIVEQAGPPLPAADARALQEPYSLRCAPQVIGSVLDHLWAAEALLLREARGCSDNPVITADAVLHAGNFHAVGAGVASDLHAVLAHQLAFLAERQLALLVDPARNGGLPPLLAASPGATSGLAGLQLAASAMVAEIRQKSFPATATALPTNLSNQDHVPMSLVGAVRTREQLELGGLVTASLAVAAAQVQHILGAPPTDALWSALLARSPRLVADRPLAAEVRGVRDLLLRAARRRRLPAAATAGGNGAPTGPRDRAGVGPPDGRLPSEG